VEHPLVPRTRELSPRNDDDNFRLARPEDFGGRFLELLHGAHKVGLHRHRSRPGVE
jgi:hypothetical protein